LSRWTTDSWYGYVNDVLISKAFTRPSATTIVDTTRILSTYWPDQLHLNAAGKQIVGAMGFYSAHEGFGRNALYRTDDIVNHWIGFIARQTLGTSARIPLDDTLPEVGEGVQIATVTFRP